MDIKTTLSAVDDVYDALKASPLASEITGKIFKDRRVANGATEDVVINSPTVNAAQLQQGLVNVNIHVPNIIVKQNGVSDDTQPNHARLRELALMAAGILKDNVSGDASFNLQQIVGPLLDEVAKDHYVNIRLDYFNINLS